MTETKKIPRHQLYGGKVGRGCSNCGKPILDFSDDEKVYCPPCGAGLGILPRTMPPYKPWYETMTEDQLAAIRARKWSSGRTRWDEDESLMLTNTGAVLSVEYQVKDAPPLIVKAGAIVPQYDGLVYYNSWQGFDRQASQAQCPFPIDTVVVDFLVAMKIDMVYGYSKDQHRLYSLAVSQLEDVPNEAIAKDSLRYRSFADKLLWESVGNLFERRRPKAVQLCEGREEYKGRKVHMTIDVPEARLLLKHVPKW